MRVYMRLGIFKTTVPLSGRINCTQQSKHILLLLLQFRLCDRVHDIFFENVRKHCVRMLVTAMQYRIRVPPIAVRFPLKYALADDSNRVAENSNDIY